MRILSKIKTVLYYFCNRYAFKSIGFRTYFKKPLCISKKYISCGKRVYAYYAGRFEAIVREGYPDPQIIIEDGVSFQQHTHLTCANKIHVGTNTAIAANVTITDIHHPYEDIVIPIEYQPLQVGEVCIGKDCKIYNNVVILPNVHIGNHVTIGANSVVTKDIPDYSVAVGMPAKVIKKYDFQTKQWEKINSESSQNI